MRTSENETARAKERNSCIGIPGKQKKGNYVVTSRRVPMAHEWRERFLCNLPSSLLFFEVKLLV